MYLYGHNRENLHQNSTIDSEILGFCPVKVRTKDHLNVGSLFNYICSRMTVHRSIVPKVGLLFRNTGLHFKNTIVFSISSLLDSSSPRQAINVSNVNFWVSNWEIICV